MALDIGDKYLSLGQCAALLGVSRQTVDTMIKRGRLRPTLETPLGKLYARAEVLRVKKVRAAKRRPVRTPVP
jgi:excisionase family DNA binding protein